MAQPLKFNRDDFDYELLEFPTQAFGQIRGRAFQFLAKHSNFNFEVANDLGDFPSDVGGNAVFSLYSRHNNAGGLSPAEAVKIIDQCCQLFLAVTFPQLKVSGQQ